MVQVGIVTNIEEMKPQACGLVFPFPFKEPSILKDEPSFHTVCASHNPGSRSVCLSAQHRWPKLWAVQGLLPGCSLEASCRPPGQLLQRWVEKTSQHRRSVSVLPYFGEHVVDLDLRRQTCGFQFQLSDKPMSPIVSHGRITNVSNLRTKN